MTSNEIQHLINEELKDESDIRNVFGVDLTKCLIVPTIQQYWDSSEKKHSENLWTVLIETPDKNGYVIYFDETANMFGLGLKLHDELFDIGAHGSFLKTLFSM